MEPRPADHGPGRIIFLNGRADLARLLASLDVFLVGVHCDLAQIDRRERDRGRRAGEGRSHVEADLIHTFGPYDFDVDTTNGISSGLTDSVLDAWRARVPGRPGALMASAADV